MTVQIPYEKRTSDILSKDMVVLEEDEEIHNMPTTRRKT